MSEEAATQEVVSPKESSTSTHYPGYTKRLLAMLLLGNMALFAVYAGLNGILIPSMVQEIDPVHKVTNLAIVTGISAIFATVLNPLGGAWSDRTRSRWGRRTPWLVGAAVATLIGSVILGLQTTILGILLGWCLAQGMGNIFQAAITAVVPDRVPREKRGVASAIVGLGPMLGMLIGMGIGNVLLHQPVLVGAAVGDFLVIAAILFVTLAPDPQNTELPAIQKLSFKESIKSFFSSLAAHDFRYAFLGRLFLILGYFVVKGYYFYLLQDYIHIESVGLKPENGVLIVSGISMVASLISIIVGGALSDKTGRRKVFVFVSSAVMALVMLIPLFWPTWPAMIFFGILNGFAFGLYMAVDTALVTLVLPKAEDNARDMGILHIANAGPQIISPFVASMIITIMGGYPTLFIWGAALSILGALMILPIRSVN